MPWPRNAGGTSHKYLIARMPKVQKLRKHSTAALSAPYVAPAAGTGKTSALLQKSGKAAATTTSTATASAAAAAGTGTGATSAAQKVTLSRGQKKRLDKKTRLLNAKRRSEAYAQALSKAAVAQSGFLFSELESSLPQKEDVVRPSASAPRSNKMKGRVAVREVERMRLIQQHPAFQRDPMAALRAHLEHVVAAADSASAPASS